MAPPRTQAVAKGAAPSAKAARTMAKPKGKAMNPTVANNEGSNVFRLEELPGEIRNHIYGYALAVDGPIHISRPVDQAASEKKECDHQELWGVPVPTGQRTIRRFLAVVKTTTKGKAVRNLKSHSVTAFSLLLTCKNISAEARPILYASNTFRFESPKAFYAFYECAHKAVAFLKDVEFVDIPERHVVVGPLSSAKNLSCVSITIKSNYIGRNALERINSYEIANLVLQCRCKVCTTHDSLDIRNLAKPGKGCIAATDDMQRRRLNTVSVRVNNFEIQLKHGDEGQSSGSADYAKQVKDRLVHCLNQTIQQNVRIANGKRFMKPVAGTAGSPGGARKG